MGVWVRRRCGKCKRNCFARSMLHVCAGLGVGKCGKTCGCVCDKGIMTGSQDIPTPTPTHTARCVSYHQWRKTRTAAQRAQGNANGAYWQRLGYAHRFPPLDLWVLEFAQRTCVGLSCGREKFEAARGKCIVNRLSAFLGNMYICMHLLISF